MGTAIKQPVPDRVKPSFVISDIRALCSALCVRVSGCQKLQITVWQRMLYSCTDMPTVGVKALTYARNQRDEQVWSLSTLFTSRFGGIIAGSSPIPRRLPRYFAVPVTMIFYSVVLQKTSLCQYTADRRLLTLYWPLSGATMSLSHPSRTAAPTPTAQYRRRHATLCRHKTEPISVMTQCWLDFAVSMSVCVVICAPTTSSCSTAGRSSRVSPLPVRTRHHNHYPHSKLKLELK